MTELDSSLVHRRLDAKFKILGLEALDLILVLLNTSILNLFFGKSNFGLYLILIFSIGLLFALYWIKRNRPHQFIAHFLKYHLSPGHFEAGLAPKRNSLKWKISL